MVISILSIQLCSICFTIDQVVDAIMVVESGKNENAPAGDKGKSIGPAQIQYVYWKDSKVSGSYSDVKTFGGAKKTMVAYWKRYCPSAFNSVDAEVLSRIHNGGPKGHQKKSTIKYWKKVQKVLKK